MKCTQCGGSDFDEDRARADLICLNCGTVLGENVVSSEVEFIESGNGQSSAIGRFVSDESKFLLFINFLGQFTGYKESRQATEQKAKKRIETICGPLYLGNDVILSAFRYYQTALFRGLTRGRPVQQMAAACIYLAARMLRVNIMLLDLSDAVSVNIYVIGHLYLHLKKQLNLVLPEMEFGDKTSIVSNTAMRLLQRMKKDWLSTGRRPSGLAAAAILVSAKIHEFNRTEEDVARIARISQQTARKRLEEFGRTPSSSLSIEAFLTVDYDEEANPPAFSEIKHISEAVEKLNEEAMHRVSEEIKELEFRIDQEMKSLAEKRANRNSWGSWPKLYGSQSKGAHHLLDGEPIVSKEIIPCVSLLSPVLLQSTPTHEGLSSPLLSNEDVIKEPETLLSKDSLRSRALLREVLDGVIDPSILETCVEDLHLLTSETGDRLCNLVMSTESSRNARDTVVELGLLNKEEKELLNDWDKAISGLQDITSSNLSNKNLKTEENKDLTDSIMKLPVVIPLPSTSDYNKNSEDTHLDLSGIDDLEIEREYLLKPREVMVKATMWYQEHGSYLEIMRR